MTWRTMKSIYDECITMQHDDTPTNDKPYLVKAPSGDRRFSNMASADTYIEDESLRIENSTD